MVHNTHDAVDDERIGLLNILFRLVRDVGASLVELVEGESVLDDVSHV